ncbi:alginate export family protein [Desulfuromonas acetoxidans]|nr:alginate export family protein [Desulfuromonas acetoxidans]NVD23800.1 alginate export family protein [Desulfuromonas acetoxidans]NVE15803.1 alginate export family protein [Desulfuromonas acetoxidans]
MIMIRRSSIVTLIVCATLCFSSAALAASTFSGYVDLRYRYEYQHHFNLKAYGEQPAKGESCDGFWLQRLRIGGSWRANDWLTVAVGMQDSRVFDSDLDADSYFYNKRLDHQKNPYEDQWELYQTYLELKPFQEHDLTLRIGRQSICYGDNRIFGPGNWGNSGSYHWDAAKLSWHSGDHFIDLLWGAHIIHEPEQFSLRHRHENYGGGFYSHAQISDDWAIEPFYVIKYDEHGSFSAESGTDDLVCHSLGSRVTGLIGPMILDATLVGQWGHFGEDDLRAWGAHFGLGHCFKHVPWQPTIKVDYCYASGDRDPDDGTRQTFLGVFGARDSMYGRINLFSWSNLHEVQATVMAKPRKHLKLTMELHRFWLAAKQDGWSLSSKTYRDKTGKSGSHVGDELDLIVQWQLPALRPVKGEKISIRAGYSRFWPGEFAKNVADNVAADWVFAQIQYSYRF